MALKQILGQLVLAAFFASINCEFVSASPVDRNQCDPIARNYTSGKLICKGEVLNFSGPIRLFCFLNHQWVNLTNFSVLGKVCDSPKITSDETLKRCTQFNQGKPGCWISKGSVSLSKPELIEPYSSALINGRPNFHWAKTPEALNYLIQVKGKGVSWSQETKSTLLSYPKGQPSLAPGEVYQVITTAFSGSTPLISDTTTLTMLSSSEISQVQNQIQFVKQQSIPSDEATYLDFDSIYRQHDLYTETINSLKSRAQEGTKNPDLYRVLANRFWQVGLPQHAQKYYEIGMILAKEQENYIVIQKINSGIAKLTANYPPK